MLVNASNHLGSSMGVLKMSNRISNRHNKVNTKLQRKTADLPNNIEEYDNDELNELEEGQYRIRGSDNDAQNIFGMKRKKDNGEEDSSSPSSNS